MVRPLRVLGLYADDTSWSTLSYARSLPRAVARYPGFALDTANIARLTRWNRVALGARLRWGRYDAVFLFHSVFSNANYVSPGLEDEIRRAGPPIVQFAGNEYKLMPEKMAFARRLGIALFVSQIAREPVLDLYRRHLGCKVMFVPNATFDPDLFAGAKSADMREIDIGYRAFEGVFYLGHDDRTRIAAIVSSAAERCGLRLDVSLDPAKRFTEADWRSFLGDCRGQLGTEAGTDFFNLDDGLRHAVNAYCEAHPTAQFTDVAAKFFNSDRPKFSGRTISSRHIEAAAARSVQLLFPGEYAGVFEAGTHYIPLARDGSDVDDALDRFADRGYRARIADADMRFLAGWRNGRAEAYRNVARAVASVSKSF